MRAASSHRARDELCFEQDGNYGEAEANHDIHRADRPYSQTRGPD